MAPSLIPDTRARRTNGATQTFRRPSHATSLSGSTNHSSSRDPAAPQNSSTSAGVYVPPHAQPGRNGSSFEGRYSRDQLTQLFRIQQASSDLNDGLSSLYMGGWEPHATNGASSASWGRKDDHGREREAPSGVDQCWDRDGSVLPLSLTDMTDDEREVGTHPITPSWHALTRASSLRSSIRLSTRRSNHPRRTKTVLPRKAFRCGRRLCRKAQALPTASPRPRARAQAPAAAIPATRIRSPRRPPPHDSRAKKAVPSHRRPLWYAVGQTIRSL